MILDYLTALLPPLRVDSVKDLHRKCGPRWRRVVLTVHGTPIPGWARRADAAGMVTLRALDAYSQSEEEISRSAEDIARPRTLSPEDLR